MNFSGKWANYFLQVIRIFPLKLVKIDGDRGKNIYLSHPSQFLPRVTLEGNSRNSLSASRKTIALRVAIWCFFHSIYQILLAPVTQQWCRAFLYPSFCHFNPPLYSETKVSKFHGITYLRLDFLLKENIYSRALSQVTTQNSKNSLIVDYEKRSRHT